jgi:hypothetical protein
VFVVWVCAGVCDDYCMLVILFSKSKRTGYFAVLSCCPVRLYSVVDFEELNVKDKIGQSRDHGRHAPCTITIVVGDMKYSPFANGHHGHAYRVVKWRVNIFQLLVGSVAT